MSNENNYDFNVCFCGDKEHPLNTIRTVFINDTVIQKKHILKFEHFCKGMCPIKEFSIEDYSVAEKLKNQTSYSIREYWFSFKDGFIKYNHVPSTELCHRFIF